MLSTVQPLAKYLRVKSVCIYDNIFTVHTKYTAVLLLICSILLSTNQYFGNPISCIGDEKNIEFANQYCWTMGTYILSYYDVATSGHNLTKNSRNTLKSNIAEGIGPEMVGTHRLYMRYYQWVILMVLLESFVFFLPAIIWKSWEDNRLKQLCGDMNGLAMSTGVRREKTIFLYKYFITNHNEQVHTYYFIKYLCCEVLNLIISIANIIVLDIFFDRFWSKYLHAVMVLPNYEWDLWNRMSSRVFPKLAKCTLPKFGVAGSANSYDMLCLLPLNILNEKVFAILWCWFLILTVLAALKLIYRVAIIFSPTLRICVLRTRVFGLSPSTVAVVVSHSSVGDWFILLKIASNINPIVFKSVMLELYEQHIKEEDEISV